MTPKFSAGPLMTSAISAATSSRSVTSDWSVRAPTTFRSVVWARSTSVPRTSAMP